jgi:hypothetical protein
MNKSTITLIMDLLSIDDFYGVSENIDIAKGKYKIPRTYKDMKNVIKRNKQYDGN